MEYGQMILGAVLILAVAAVAYGVFSRWKESRTPSPQRSPEEAKSQWLQRERESARQQNVTPNR